MRIASALFCLLAAHGLAWGEPQDTQKIQIFTLSNRPAAATVDIVRAVLKPGETVWPEDRLQRLIVKASPESLAEVQKLLDQLDVPAPQVWLTVTQTGARPYSSTGGGVALTPGGRVVVGAQNTQVQQNVNESQKLLVMSGEKGHIVVGQDIPYVQPYWSYANGLGLAPAGVVWQQVSTGFAVEPTVIGQTVRLRITPWLGYLGAQGRGNVEFSEAASTFTLQNGQSITIGSGSGGQSRQSSSFGLILGGGSEQSSSSSTVTVQATIQEL